MQRYLSLTYKFFPYVKVYEKYFFSEHRMLWGLSKLKWYKRNLMTFLLMDAEVIKEKWGKFGTHVQPVNILHYFGSLATGLIMLCWTLLCSRI